MIRLRRAPGFPLSLIHEFGALAGLTPAWYRPIDAASPNHVAA